MIFGEVVLRYIDILERTGSPRTAFEFAKLLLSFEPIKDPFGMLLMLDYYAMRSGEVEYMANFCRDFTSVFYQNDGGHAVESNLILLPNLLFSTSIARFTKSGKA